MIDRQTFREILRFGIVGTISTAFHYGIYWVLQHWMNVNIAYTAGYLLSLMLNYYLSARFTFRKGLSAKSSVGFSGAHLVNYLLHIVLLNTFISFGVGNEVAPLLVFCIAIPVNFVLVRFVFRHS
jgi:putative flippase GtrA